jgi:hypothetical protein
MDPTYNDIVVLSARKYLDQIQSFARTKPETVIDVLLGLTRTIRKAIDKKGRLTTRDISFNESMLQSLSLYNRAKLINQYSLGLGSALAPVIFVGTEHAYDLTDTLPFTLEAVGLTILWLCGGKPEVTTKISGIPWVYDVPFHIHPNALYRVHETKQGQHTWKVLASIVAQVMDMPEPIDLLRGTNPGLGDLTYQVELSTYPALRSFRGQEPTSNRIEFLEELLSAMRKTSRVVVFHGKQNQEAWQSYRLRLSRRFLGLESEEDIHFYPEQVEGTRLKLSTSGSRRVIFTRALNGAVSNEYRSLVACKIKEMI